MDEFAVHDGVLTVSDLEMGCCEISLSDDDEQTLPRTGSAASERREDETSNGIGGGGIASSLRTSEGGLVDGIQSGEAMTVFENDSLVRLCEIFPFAVTLTLLEFRSQFSGWVKTR